MTDDTSWTKVADAWEQVFDDVADLGRGVVEDLRRGFESRQDAEGAFAGDESALESATANVRHSVESARHAFDEFGRTLAEGGRGERLSKESQGVLKSTLQALGSSVNDLADRLDSPD